MTGKKKAVVTGSTSFIGLALLNQLMLCGYEAVAIARPNSLRRSFLPTNTSLKIIEVDLATEPLYAYKDFANTDTLFHLGWCSNFDNPRYNLAGQMVNVSIFQKIASFAEAIGCSKIVCVGSQAECGRISGSLSEQTPDHPETAYAVAKCEAYRWGKEWCPEHGISLYWPRLLSAYGPHDHESTMIISCLQAACRHQSMAFTKCEQIWDYIFVEDVADALIRIAERGTPHIKYSIASGNGTPLRDYIQTIAEITTNHQLLNGIGKISYTKDQVMHLVGDIRKLQEDTGFTPKIPFDEGIRRTLHSDPRFSL